MRASLPARFGGAVAAIALAACGRGDGAQHGPIHVDRGASVPAASEPAPRRQVDAGLLDALALLSMGRPADAALGAGAREQWLTRLRAGEATLDGYVDSALASADFLDRIAAPVMLGEDTVRSGKLFVIREILKSTGEGAQAIYYLRKPCSRAKAVKVKPWWKLDSQVLVCADSYRPRLYRHRDRGRWVYCGAMLEKSECGCGPNLIRCMTGAHKKQLYSDTERELTRTAAYVAGHDLPLSTLFTMNETVRDWSTELVYRRFEVATGNPTDLTSRLANTDGWSTPELRPRRELWTGQHAGILTMTKVIRGQADARQAMREIYRMMWCSSVESKGATAHAVLSLGKSSLQGLHEGWEELAHRPVCTGCHARLDYGMQFFLGYADPRSPGAYAMPGLVRSGKVPLYGRDIDDPRGEEIATPAGFARLATAQPEFAACMSQRVVSHVFGHDATPADRDSVRAAYDSAPTLRSLMKTALLRYADQWMDAHVDTGSVASTASARPASDAKRLHSLLEEHCFACHDDAQAPDLTVDVLPRDVMFKVVAQVAYSGMPKGENDMTADERAELVRLALHSALPERAWPEAESYFVDRGAALTVHGIEAVFATIDWLAGGKPAAEPGPATPDGWSVYERAQDYGADARQWTPSFSATIGFKALEACHRAGFTGDELDACLERVTDPAALSKTVHPIGPRAAR